MLTDERVRRYLGAGMHMAVGTADAQGNPCVCDAVALEVQPSGSAVTVYLPVAIAAETVANLATNGRVAIVSTFPPDHGTVQLKGRSRAVRLAGEEQRALVAASLERLADAEPERADLQRDLVAPLTRMAQLEPDKAHAYLGRALQILRTLKSAGRQFEKLDEWIAGLEKWIEQS